MAYIVLTAGAVMALLGALAIITGYPIIQIERGWATVIAGTTLLAGGGVTMAVGVAVRALIEMRAALTNAAFASPSHLVSAPYATPHAEPSFGPEPTHAPAEPASNYGALALGAAAAVVPVTALAVAARPNPEPLHPEAKPAHSDVAHEPIEHEPIQHEPIEHEPLDETPVRVEHEPSSPPMDDWLDKAFADLALEKTPSVREVDHGPSTQVEPEPLHPGPSDFEHDAPAHVGTQHDGEILYAEPHEVTAVAVDPGDRHDEAVHDATHHDAHHEAEHDVHVGHDEAAHAPVEHYLEPMTEPAPVAPEGPAVIGRYEADGTAYTMYADGSIEAQSDAGIYRFASMADLKAFIEG